MEKRIFNFSAGPGVLPESVLKEAQENMLNWKGAGLSVMEMSHRSKEYGTIINETRDTLREILSVPESHDILFLQGGANLQFAMIPLNFLTSEETGDYLLTGNWAEKAFEEATKVGKKAHCIASSKEQDYSFIPKADSWNFSSNPAYVHYTSNNTIYGTQFRELPDFGNKMAVCDMSSDFLCRPVDVSKFGLIYAGAQKNAGPAGTTIVIVRKDLLDKKATENLPTMMKYKIHSSKESMYNTPPTFAIYMCGLVFKWIKSMGGLEAMKKHNEKKAGFVYNAIDNSNGFYTGTAAKEDRSLMNITFRLPTAELDAKFIEEAKKIGIMSIKGYRSVGGIRTSTYNALPMEAVEKLAEFMDSFKKNN